MVSQSDWVSMGRLSFQLCLKCLLYAQVLEAWPPVLGHLYWEEGLWRWLASEGLTSGVCCPIHRSTALWAIRERERCYGRGLIGDSRSLESCAWKQYFPLTSPALLFLCILAIVSEQLFSPACSPANNLPQWMAQSHWSWVTVDWQLTLQLMISLSGWLSHTVAEWPWADSSETVSQNKPRKVFCHSNGSLLRAVLMISFDGLLLYLVISPSGLLVTARKWVYLIHPWLWCLQRQDLQDTAFFGSGTFFPVPCTLFCYKDLHC